MSSRGNLFVLSAPSGAGKSTILKEVMGRVTSAVFSVSHTTRKPRPRERDGVEYYFVTRDQFLALRDHHGFLEWAEVHGNLYGTSREALEKQLASGLDVILDIDVQGAVQLRDAGLAATFIFILPPSWQELERRLVSRATDDPQTVALRLANARKEIQALDLYDHVIVNETIPQCADMVRAVLLSRRSAMRRSMEGTALDLSSFG